MKLSRVLCATVVLFGAVSLSAQRERQIQPAPEEAAYSRKFFTQLRAVFGRFRDSDLQRAFEKAQPIQCSELVNDKGEWRTVAFFNEKRELGDWYRSNFEEVKRDLAVFIFTGVCRGEHGSVPLTTKFPVTESIAAYSQGRIGPEEVDVNVNAPVRASFDSQTQAYSFDLPYLFLVSRQDNVSVYTLEPPRLAERDRYAPDVTDHWDCKSVTAEAVTYQFLICRTTTLPRDPSMRRQARVATFGASAYFILSDGKEASSSVKLTFNDASDKERSVEDASGSDSSAVGDSLDAHGPAGWETPGSDEKIMDVVRDEFRIPFAAVTWTGRIGAAQVLAGRRLSSLASSNPPAGADYCVWLPGNASAVNRLLMKDPDEPVSYSVTAHDQSGNASTSVLFDIRAAAGTPMGTLECFFPRVPSAASIAVGRWTSTVGDYLSIDVMP